MIKSEIRKAKANKKQGRNFNLMNFPPHFRDFVNNEIPSRINENCA